MYRYKDVNGEFMANIVCVEPEGSVESGFDSGSESSQPISNHNNGSRKINLVFINKEKTKHKQKEVICLKKWNIY